MLNRIHFLNAFTANGFGGNPTAVFFSRKAIESEAMQMLAKELPVPVTAFAWAEGDVHRIRYFTAQCEIAACGHATLGAAAVGAELLQTDTVLFRTSINASIATTVNGGRVNMKYEARNLSPASAEVALLKSLGMGGAGAMEAFRYGDTLVLVLNDAERIPTLQPDIRRLQRSSMVWDEVVVTAAPKGGPYDYILRSFCPWIGIDEDPVTGSVQAALAPFWGERLGKKTLAAYQASARGGELFLEVSGDAVFISGHCTMLSSLRGC